MTSPNRREMLAVLIAFAWFALVGPGLLIAAARLGLAKTEWQLMAIGIVYIGVFFLLTALVVGAYYYRVFREAGGGGLAWSLAVLILILLLSGALRGCLRMPPA